MKKIYTVLIFLSVISIQIFSWDSEAANFFPLAVGNSWTYTKYMYAPACIPVDWYDYQVSITGDSVIDGHKYYRFSNGNLMRIDSNSMNVYRRAGATECLTDSLLAKLGDHYYTCQPELFLNDTNYIVFDNQKRYARTFSIPDYSRKLLYGIGLYYDGGDCIFFVGGTKDILKGCVINGEVIGDTSLTPVNFDFLRYYPLQVGNVWVYDGFGFPCCGPYIFRINISGSVVFNGHLYYIMKSTIAPDSNYVRVDSSTGIILYRNTTNSCGWLTEETTGDSLAARINNTSLTSCSDTASCTDTTDQQIFGMTKKGKIFYNGYFEGYNQRKYIIDIGLANIEDQLHMGHDSRTLKGCVINGVVYGDTSMTGINKISSAVPEKFSLYQNYPNPFNPATLIKFEIPNMTRLQNGQESGIVTLKIYDVLGREVQTLVNEKLTPGTYEVDFDGSNLSSGVYYYTLMVGEFTQTRKMVLIK